MLKCTMILGWMITFIAAGLPVGAHAETFAEMVGRLLAADPSLNADTIIQNGILEYTDENGKRIATLAEAFAGPAKDDQIRALQNLMLSANDVLLQQLATYLESSRTLHIAISSADQFQAITFIGGMLWSTGEGTAERLRTFIATDLIKRLSFQLPISTYRGNAVEGSHTYLTQNFIKPLKDLLKDYLYYGGVFNRPRGSFRPFISAYESFLLKNIAESARRLSTSNNRDLADPTFDALIELAHDYFENLARIHCIYQSPQEVWTDHYAKLVAVIAHAERVGKRFVEPPLSVVHMNEFYGRKDKKDLEKLLISPFTEALSFEALSGALDGATLYLKISDRYSVDWLQTLTNLYLRVTTVPNRMSHHKLWPKVVASLELLLKSYQLPSMTKSAKEVFGAVRVVVGIIEEHGTAPLHQHFENLLIGTSGINSFLLSVAGCGSLLRGLRENRININPPSD